MPDLYGYINFIPLVIMDRLKATLDSLLYTNVIAQVTEHASWVHSLVSEKKDKDTVRVSLEPSDLNKAILR